jgi:actin-related protein 6
VNVGGKLLTNYLKELVPINMADETFVMNIVKEKLCYVSSDFNADLAITKAYEHEPSAINAHTHSFPNNQTRETEYDPARLCAS